MHNNYIVRKSFHTLIAGSILEVHCRSSRKEKVINIHDINGRTVDEQACCFGCDSYCMRRLGVRREPEHRYQRLPHRLRLIGDRKEG